MLAKCPTKLETRVEHLLRELPGGEVGGTGGGGVAAGPGAGAGAGPPTLLLHLIGPPRDARLCIILLLNANQRNSVLVKLYFFSSFPFRTIKSMIFLNVIFFAAALIRFL